MELIYSNDQLIMVTHVKHILAGAHIKCQIKNEFVGAGAGDIAPLDTWPELWVDSEDVERAKAVIAQMNNDSNLVWYCNQCDEENPMSFDICWQCEHEKQAE